MATLHVEVTVVTPAVLPNLAQPIGVGGRTECGLSHWH